MTSRPIITIDFETRAIAARPDYPPDPVGVAIVPPGEKRGRYLAWGHPCENNATFDDGRRVIRRAWDSGAILLFHNHPFDVEVAIEAFGVGWPDPERIRDTLFEAFLWDPNAEALNLKDLASRYLNKPPSERDELFDWLDENVPEARRTKSKGAFISLAPGRLVGKYAAGDVERTLALHRFFSPRVEREMNESYARERELAQILVEMERAGVPIDARRLAKDEALWTRRLAALDRWLARKLGMAEDASIDERDEFADALERAGLVEAFILTEKGRRSTSFENLVKVIRDPLIASVYGYRAKLATSVRTFARPWLEMAQSGGGRIFTRWNQVRSHDEDRRRAFGARTGRLSSNPNFQNIPVRLPIITEDPDEYQKLMARGVDAFVVPKGAGLWLLPNLRDYIAVARSSGSIFVDGDFSQQELKILAHYERGEMMRAYLEDPDLDLHEHARVLINTELNADWDRKPIKNTGFAVIYGTGVGHFAEMIRTDVATARTLRDAYKTRVFPGLGRLDRELRMRTKGGRPISTRGGRLYHVEPPRIIKGDVRHFEYKLINTLIQGSAADMMKATMVAYDRVGGTSGRMVLTVHDQLVTLVRSEESDRERERMIEAGRALKFDVPIEMKFERGFTWARTKEW